MTTPGQNLLNRAARVIRMQTVQWSAWQSNATDGLGVVVPTYAAAAPIQASVQPVSRAMYTLFNLDVQKSYTMVYTPQLLRDLTRNGSCDLIDWDGRRYNVESLTNWFSLDRWVGSICVDVGATPA